MLQTNDDNVEIVSLKNFTENAYLNYSMYVIMDRALPFIGDGLKPVQRRIVYAMSELGLNNRAKYKKSARTVGDVLGKYHPHGDSACYEAMVLMAQPFSYRYPLIDGQGNWGAPDDPKSFAAMRYTESRLAPYANLLLQELSQGTVDFSANFDGTLEEPKALPARLPNILLNGTTGIAVGMATDIPPHNLREVSQAVIALLDNPKLTLEELLTLIPAPDYPTGAEIISSRAELQRLYQTGKGSVRIRATWTQEDGDIVITSLPYQVSTGKIMEQIVQQMRSKKLLLVEDLKDESDQANPVRLIIVPRSNRVDTEQLMSHLFATTDLERSYRVNLNMLGLDGRPNVKNLLEILNEWIEYRKLTVTKRLQFRLDKINARLHLVAGFLITYLNVDEVIHIIREEEQPKPILKERFQLSEQQVEAILELKLRHLAKLEEFKLSAEQKELNAEQLKLQSLLNNSKKLVRLIKKEIQQDSELYGDERRTVLVERNVAQTIVAQEIIHSEPITVILSKMGWIRCAKGHELDSRALNYKTGDEYFLAIKTKTDLPLILFDTQGKSYTLDPSQLPSARGQGESITNWLSLTPGVQIVQMVSAELSQRYLLASSAGYGFICQSSDLLAKNKNGKNLINLSDGAKLLPPLLLPESVDNFLLSISHTGRMLCFPVDELPTLAKGKGNKIIGITQKQFQEGEFLRHITLLPNEATITLYSGKRKITFTWKELQKYFALRASKGTLLPRGIQRIENIDIII